MQDESGHWTWGTSMYEMLNLNPMQGLLAQCSCGGGSGGRISYWAALIAVAVVLLCGFTYDLYAQRRGNTIDSHENAEPRGNQPGGDE